MARSASRNRIISSTSGLIVLLAAGILTACGGGSAPAEDPTQVRLDGATPATFSVSTFEDQPAASPTLTVALGGPVQALQGETVYAITEAPQALFRGSHTLTLHTGTAPTAEIVLHSRADDRPTPGVYENELKLYACLDTACQRMLRNAPLTIHYTVTVLAR